MTKPTHRELIQKKRKRREKLKRLRGKYKTAKTEKEKKKILERLRKFASNYDFS